MEEKMNLSLRLSFAIFATDNLYILYYFIAFE